MKKKSILKVLLLTLLACCLAFALVACGGTTYTVTYDYNDGGATQSTTIEVDEGSLLEEPTAPTRDGYTFDGWFNGDAEWTFATDTVTGDITLTAHWTQNVTPPPAHTHTYGDYTLTTAPTESAAGVATATCSGCEEGTEGHTTTMALPMLTAENIASAATDGKYTVATTPATCTAAGSSVYTYHYNGDKTLVAATVTLDKLEHTYGDYTVTTAPTADAAGVATATCSVCAEGTEGHTTTMTLPALTEENIAAEAADGKYTVATTPATCAAAGSSVYTYHYDGDKTLVAVTVTLDKLEHTWGEWTVETLPAIDGSTEGAAVRTCTRANCGAEDELTLPKIAFGSDGSPTNYAVGTSEDPTCQKEGYGTLTYTVPEAQGGGTIELRYTLDKVPHSYGTPVYQDSKLTASCTYNCGTAVTATLTFAGGEDATGTAPTKLRVEFDGTSFTVTLPECTFERSGYAFTGWSNGTETLSGTITLKADDNVTLTATWEPTSEVGTAEDFLAALQNAEVPNITLNADIRVNQAVVIDRDVTINLGGHNLTIATAQDATILNDLRIGTLVQQGEADKIASVNINNGNLIIDSPLSYLTDPSNWQSAVWDGSYTGICIEIDSTLSLTNVHVTSSITGIFVAGGTLNMNGGSINADGCYAVGTNATVRAGTSVYAPAHVTITNATLTAAGDWQKGDENDSAAAMFNVEGTFVLNNVTLTGERQGVIVRGAADVTINGGSVTSNGTYTDNDSRLTGQWGSGTEVPMAAIAIGDRGNNSSYAGESKLTLLGSVQIIAEGAAKAIYISADSNTTATINCACTYEDQIVIADIEETMLEKITVNLTHGYGEADWTEGTPATCTETGTLGHYTCPDCDKYFDKEGKPLEDLTAAIDPDAHKYGDPVLAAEGENAGKFVVICSYCDSQLIVAEAKSNKLEVTFANGRTGYALDETIAADDFTVTLTYAYTTAWGDFAQGYEFTVAMSQAEYDKYFSNNLEELSADEWANDLEATFTFAVGGTTVAEGAITFDVVPSASQLGIGDATVLYNQVGVLNNVNIGGNASQAFANVETTGMSVSFWLSEEITNDWSSALNSYGISVGLPNLDPWNALSDEDFSNALRGTNRVPDASVGNFANTNSMLPNERWSVFLRSVCYVTITLRADGGIDYYKNGVKVISYSATDSLNATYNSETGTWSGAQDKTVADFTAAFLQGTMLNGFVFAGAINANGIIVTTALTDAGAKGMADWYFDTYYPMDVSSLGSDITVFQTHADASAERVLVGANVFEDISLNDTGLAVSFYLGQTVQLTETAVGEWNLILINTGDYNIATSNLDPWWTSGSVKETNCYGSASANATLIAGNCYVTISWNTDGSVSIYINGSLAHTHSATTQMGTATVATFTSEMLSAIQTNGFTVGGSNLTNPAITDLIVTDALTPQEYATVYAFQQSLRA